MASAPREEAEPDSTQWDPATTNRKEKETFSERTTARRLHKQDNIKHINIIYSKYYFNNCEHNMHRDKRDSTRGVKTENSPGRKNKALQNQLGHPFLGPVGPGNHSRGEDRISINPFLKNWPSTPPPQQSKKRCTKWWRREQ